MVSLETPVCEFNKPAVDFSLPGVDGGIWTLEECRGARGLLVMFICNHCPYVKAVRERLVQDTRELKDLGVNSVAIMSNDPALYDEDSFENMQAIAREYSFPFPYLLDESQAVARSYGAVCTPDFFGYNSQLELQYRGRLDAACRQRLPMRAGTCSRLCAWSPRPGGGRKTKSPVWAVPLNGAGKRLPAEIIQFISYHYTSIRCCEIHARHPMPTAIAQRDKLWENSALRKSGM